MSGTITTLSPCRECMYGTRDSALHQVEVSGQHYSRADYPREMGPCYLAGGCRVPKAILVALERKKLACS